MEKKMETMFFGVRVWVTGDFGFRVLGNPYPLGGSKN